MFSVDCTWSSSEHRVTLCLAYQDKSAGGKSPVYVKLSLSAVIPSAVSHHVSFVAQLSWKTAALTGGFQKQEAAQEMQETIRKGTKGRY